MTLIGVAEIKYSLKILLRKIPLQLLKEEFYLLQHPQRQKEWLTARLLVVNLLKKTRPLSCIEIEKDNFGSPFLKNSPYHLSISHSHQYCAVILSLNPTAIDIQYIDKSLLKLKHRFLNLDEKKIVGDDLKTLTIYWSIKEVLYKYYRKGGLIFKKHLSVEKNELDRWRGYILTEDSHILDIEVFTFDNFVMSWVKNIAKLF